MYDAVYPWVKGGGEKRIYELSRRLVKRGHDVHLFGLKWWEGSDIIENEGVIIHGVGEKMELYINGRRSISEALVFSIKLLPYLAKEKFDIIDVTAFPYFSILTTKLISLIKNIPLVITWHEVWGDYWYEYLGWKGFFGKFIENIASKLGKPIAVSNKTRNNLKYLYNKDNRIPISPNGIDLDRISEITSDSEKCDVIFAGRLIKEKNIDVLIDAIYLLVKDGQKDIKCHIIGDGPEKDELIKLVHDKGLEKNIFFFGFIDHDGVISKIKASKLFVLPSSREGFGIVVIEAFACGIPVITVNCEQNAASELINQETGLVTDLDIYKLADAINKLRYGTSFKIEMELIKKYDWNNIVDGLINIYEYTLY